MKDVHSQMLSQQSLVDDIAHEVQALKNTYEQLASEERLRDPLMSLTPEFGAYVYAWTIKQCSYKSND